MKTILEELKYVWNKQGNGVARLILINVLVYIVCSLVWLVGRFIGYPYLYDRYVFEYTALPPDFQDFIYHPWTLFTYFFTHSITDFFHIVFNMLGLYWFGSVFKEFLGSKRLVALYMFGGIFGGITYLLVYNLVPFYQPYRFVTAGMIGASASVYAITVGVAMIAPNYSFSLFFSGLIVPAKYLAFFYIFISLLGTVGANAGGNIAHLGGALMGAIFVWQLKKGNDWSAPFTTLAYKMRYIFNPKRKLTVSYTSNSTKKQPKVKKEPLNEQQLIDTILDKISESGYEKLSTEEKQILFKASQKK